MMPKDITMPNVKFVNSGGTDRTLISIKSSTQENPNVNINHTIDNQGHIGFSKPTDDMKDDLILVPDNVFQSHQIQSFVESESSSGASVLQDLYMYLVE